MPALTVVTWNVRAAIGPGPFPPTWWRRTDPDRLAAIGAFLASLEADLIALQECAALTVDGETHDTAAALAARTSLEHRFAATRHFPIAEDDGRVGGAGLFGNALLSGLPIRSTRTVALPMAPSDAFVEPPGTDHPAAGVRYTDAAPDIREPRCLLLAEIELAAGAPLRVGSVHLSHVGSGERALQASAAAEAFGPEAGASVLAGDLNAAIESDELSVLRDGWTDAFAAVGVPHGDPGRATTEDGHRIDHILVRGGWLVRECRRLDEAGWLSDHLPVLAVLERG